MMAALEEPNFIESTTDVLERTVVPSLVQSTCKPLTATANRLKALAMSEMCHCMISMEKKVAGPAK